MLTADGAQLVLIGFFPSVNVHAGEYSRFVRYIGSLTLIDPSARLIRRCSSISDGAEAARATPAKSTEIADLKKVAVIMLDEAIELVCTVE